MRFGCCQTIRKHIHRVCCAYAAKGLEILAVNGGDGEHVDAELLVNLNFKRKHCQTECVCAFMQLALSANDLPCSKQTVRLWWQKVAPFIRLMIYHTGCDQSVVALNFTMSIIVDLVNYS